MSESELIPGSALKNRGDTHAELIEGGNAYSRRGQTSGSDCRAEPTSEEGALREETDRGCALHLLCSRAGGVPPLFVCHHFSWARFCTPTPKPLESEIPQERQKERKRIEKRDEQA